MSIDHQLIVRQRRLEADCGLSEQPIQVHRDGPIHGDTQSIVAVAPIFNESYIREGLSGSCGHGVMIPL
jgi:hypothetical protein